jgi:hypothetical protein
MEIWTLTTNALRRYDDVRQIVVDYAYQQSATGPSTSRAFSRRSSARGAA